MVISNKKHKQFYKINSNFRIKLKNVDTVCISTSQKHTVSSYPSGEKYNYCSCRKQNPKATTDVLQAMNNCFGNTKYNSTKLNETEILGTVMKGTLLSLQTLNPIENYKSDTTDKQNAT